MNTTLDRLVLSTNSVTEQEIPVDTAQASRPKKSDKNTESAIYAYIQAVRALGRATINTIDISEALSIPISEVNQAIRALEKKGVKIVNG